MPIIHGSAAKWRLLRRFSCSRIILRSAMKFRNDTHLMPLGRTRGGAVEGKVRVRGVRLGSGERAFSLETREPIGVILRGEDEVRELPIGHRSRNWLWYVAPPLAYVSARMAASRRRK
jgi:hypothetical protein